MAENVSSVEVFRTTIFDKKWYSKSYPDVNSFPGGEFLHYKKFGWRLGRKPSKAISTTQVEAASGNAVTFEMFCDTLLNGLTLPKNRQNLTSSPLSTESVVSEALTALRRKQYSRFYKLLGTVSDRYEYLYLEVEMFSKLRCHKSCLESAEKFLELGPSHNLKPKQIEDVLVAKAKALTRLGLGDQALNLVRAELQNRTSSRLEGVYTDLLWVKYPKKAMSQLSASKSLSFKDQVLYLNLLINSKQFDLAQGFYTKWLARLNRPDKKSEARLLKSNLELGLDNVNAAQQATMEFWGAFDMPAPELQDSSKPLSISNIKNAVKNHTQSKFDVNVSVIMTVFNSQDTLRSAIESVLAQHYKNLELIIVDDVSSDDSFLIAKEFCEKDSRVKLVSNDINLGTYVSKSNAISLAKGRYVTFHDSDDWMHPSRIKIQVDEMDADSSIKCTRSSWVRIDKSGRFIMTRWGKSFLHDNPASTMFRKDVFSDIGVFDSVKTGADTEFLVRFQTVFGNDALKSIKLPLTLGYRHEESLTTSGVAALNEELYSEVRDDYTSSWVNWHRENHENGLRLDYNVDREFDAPKALESIRVCRVESPRLPVFYFGISLASASVGDWNHTKKMLSHTLQSLLNQVENSWVCLICGHEKPDVPEIEDSRVVFLKSDKKHARSPKEYRGDKKRKRQIILDELRVRGGGYFMPLDADDLVHKDLVSYVLTDNNSTGYSIRKGYALDYQTKTLAPVPGVWDASFDQVCGSSAIFYLEVKDIPSLDEIDKNLSSRQKKYIEYFEQHGYWRVSAQEFGRPLADVPFSAGVYVLNHAQNLSFSMQRVDVRKKTILENIAKNAVSEVDVSADFDLHFG